MLRTKFIALSALSLMALAAPAHAQKITEYVVNSSSGSISRQDYSCTSATCSPLPPSSISASGTSSAFGAIPTGTGTTAYMRVTYGTSAHQCRFITQTNKINGVCSSPITSYFAYAGSPTCSLAYIQQQPNCDVTVVYQYIK